MVESCCVVLRVYDLSCLMRLHGCRGDDLRRRKRAAFGYGCSADATGMALGRGFRSLMRRCLGLAGNVEDVEFAARGRFSGVVFGWVVGDVVPVNDVVVPVPLALFQCAVLKLEASQPAAALFGVLGEWELSGVVVP